MSHRLIGRNADLQQLRNEGYEIDVKNAHLLVYNIPYITSKREIARGVLVAPLGDLAGEKTVAPQDHVIYFTGEHPCDQEGKILAGIQHTSQKKTLAPGVDVDHSFSNKPTSGFKNYYEKVVNYERIIVGHAQSIDPSAKSQNFKPVRCDDDEDIPFHYLDANSARAGIEMVSEKLKNLKIAIVGLGGTGSYILDLVSKSPVNEIHIFDGDSLLTHNAFRAPGAVPIEVLEASSWKVTYFQEIYSKLHKRIIPHNYYLTEENIDELTGLDFVFVCVDQGEAKKIITNKLIEKGIPFIDVGIGVHEVDNMLVGSARITTVTKEQKDHFAKLVPFVDAGDNDYNRNIQIAEINALNASLAVIRWKKMFGFYHVADGECHALYDIGANNILKYENFS